MPRLQVWLHSPPGTSRFSFLPKIHFSTLCFSPAKVGAKPNPNKALAQNRVHFSKRWCQLATQTDETLYSENLSVRVGAHSSRMCECCICVSLWPSLHQQTVFGGLRRGFEVISWEPLAEANALPGEEWHHGIKRGDSFSKHVSGWQKTLMTAYKLSEATWAVFMTPKWKLSNSA